MHFHHRHDLDGCTAEHADQPVLATILATLDRMESRLMSANQDLLNAIGTQIEDVIPAIEAALAKPAAEESLDFTPVQSAVAKLQGLVPPSAAPAVPAPAVDVPAPVEVPPVAADVPAPAADVPAPAVVDPNAPVDITVPAQGVPSVPLA